MLISLQIDTAILKQAAQEGRSVRDVAVEMGLLKDKEADKLLDPLVLTDMEQTQKLMQR